MEKFNQLNIALQTIVKQTETRKTKGMEQASRLPSKTQTTFFQCDQVPLKSVLSNFKRFESSGDKAIVLRTEVRRYVNLMRTKYLAGEVKELDHVQPEIQNNFWINTQSCLRNEFEMISEEMYFFKVGDEDTEVDITGKTDHVIRVCDSNLSAATLEDKQNCLEMDQLHVSQVVTQVKFQVDRLIDSINFAPAEYVGLLQNGPEWIAVLRKIVYGKVFWTHVRTTPAFTVNSTPDGELSASEINPKSCEEIARLIEHAYCTADIIADVINDPTKNPMSALYTIDKYRYLSDDEVDDAEEDDAAEDGTPPEDEVVGTVAPARQSARQQQQQQQKNKKADSSGRKNSLNDRGTVGSPLLSLSQEYFVLPLTRGNVACH